MDSELKSSLELCFWAFKKLGMWQNGDQTWAYLVLGGVAHFLLVENLALTAFISALTTMKSFNATALGLIFTVIAFITLALKSLNFVIKLKKIEKLYESIKELMEFSADPKCPNRDHIRKEVKIVDKIFKAFAVFAVFSFATVAIQTFATHQLPNKISLHGLEKSEIGFYFAAFYFTAGGFYMTCFDICLNVLPVIFMSFAIGFINELCDKLKEIGKLVKIENPIVKAHKNGKSSKAKSLKIIKEEARKYRNFKQNEEVIKCIETHVKIKDFVGKIEESFSAELFAQGLMSSVVLCICVFTISQVSFMKKKHYQIILIKKLT
jgi:hypothetical protein